MVIGSLVSFKGKNCKVADNVIMGYGIKQGLVDSVEEIEDLLENEKEEFVNW